MVPGSMHRCIQGSSEVLHNTSPRFLTPYSAYTAYRLTNVFQMEPFVADEVRPRLNINAKIRSHFITPRAELSLYWNWGLYLHSLALFSLTSILLLLFLQSSSFFQANCLFKLWFIFYSICIIHLIIYRSNFTDFFVSAGFFIYLINSFKGVTL